MSDSQVTIKLTSDEALVAAFLQVSSSSSLTCALLSSESGTH